MKGLKKFIEDLAKDNKLREKFKDLKDVKEIVNLAEKEGYKFTEDEYMDKQMEAVSGGVFSIGRFNFEDIDWSQMPEKTIMLPPNPKLTPLELLNAISRKDNKPLK